MAADRIPALCLALCAVVMMLTAGMAAAFAQEEAGPRARDLGIAFAGEPGQLNAITDVPGVRVGHVTLTGGEARTGATAILPRGQGGTAGVAAGYYAFNGTGELTGTHFIEEFGGFFGPVILTGTLGVGEARNGVLQWTKENFDDPFTRFSRILPVIGETYDGTFSDAWSFPLKADHVVTAIEKAEGGPVAEGSVGGGTGMMCYEFKCGIGTASRVVRYGEDAAYTIGVIVQANHGRRAALTLAGHRVGAEIDALMPRWPGEGQDRAGDGSLIIVIATDAPLLPSQLKRLARRGTVGLARTGGHGDSLSGDIFLAFSTANPIPLGSGAPIIFESLPGESLDPLLQAVAEASEEAIANALVAGQDMAGRDGSFVYAIPHEQVTAIMRGKAHD